MQLFEQQQLKVNLDNILNKLELFKGEISVIRDSLDRYYIEDNKQTND